MRDSMIHSRSFCPMKFRQVSLFSCNYSRCLKAGTSIAQCSGSFRSTDPNPDPDPSIIKKNRERKTLEYYCFVTFKELFMRKE
jgi:hypothetical protein